MRDFWEFVIDSLNSNHIPFRLSASGGLEAKTHEAEAKTHEAKAEATTHEARFFGLEAEASRPNIPGTQCTTPKG